MSDARILSLGRDAAVLDHVFADCEGGNWFYDLRQEFTAGFILLQGDRTEVRQLRELAPLSDVVVMTCQELEERDRKLIAAVLDELGIDDLYSAAARADDARRRLL